MEIDTLLAARVRALRQARNLTLGQLADLSGVSRSMISLIERQETSPTAAVLNKLADALGISLPTLFAVDVPCPRPEPLSRCADQAVWTDPASGYERRHLSPVGIDLPVELVEVRFPAGETVVFDSPLRQQVIHQQLWMIQGAMDIILNEQTWHLAAGDCLAMTLGPRITFHNSSPESARYLLALTTTHLTRRPA